jgi:hypothetical protein
LLPLVIIYLLDKIPVDIEINNLTRMELDHILKDGVIVFFFCAIMGSIWVDILLSGGIIIDEINSFVKIKWLTEFVIIFLPVLFLIILSSIYLLIVYENMPEDYFQKISWFPRVLIGFSFAYCISNKMYNFIQEED